MFDYKVPGIARVVAVMATLLVIGACGSEPAPAKTDINVTGLVTRLGICAKPKLAQQLGVSSTSGLRLVPPDSDALGDSGNTEVARFTGSVALVVIDDKLVKIHDVTQLTPCASDDRVQCTTDAGHAEFADGTFGGVKANERLEVHAPWRFRNYTQTWVTLNGRAAQIDAPIAHCES